jgi:RNA polymerase sigma factor (TIGR02999 family)
MCAVTAAPGDAMQSRNPADITQLLSAARAGDETAVEAFWRLVHGELHALAARALEHERPGHTLPPTALVNEAYLRLLGREQLPWENRAHFFGAAAQAMRRILVDHARARQRLRRGGQVKPVSLDEVEPPGIEGNFDFVELDEALQRLAQLDPRLVQVVELRFFAGMSVAEIARMLGVATGTVAGDWKIARLWLHRELGRNDDDGP